MKALLLIMLAALVPVGSVSAGEQFACNARALNKTERARYQELTRALFAAVKEKSETPDGYALRLPAEQLIAAAEWVSFERRCCPFLTFVLEQPRDSGPLRLGISGPEGVKAFIREEFQF